MEKPSTSIFESPSALMKAMAFAAIPSMEVGTSPELLETPALLNRITSRSLATPLVMNHFWAGLKHFWAAMNHHGRALIIQPTPHRVKVLGLLSRNRRRSAPW